MTLKGNSSRYGSVAVTLHWVSAAAVLALLVLGFMAANAPDEARETTLLRLHVPLGTAVLALTSMRVAWWFFDTRPDGPAGQPRWQALAAHTSHLLLYVALILVGVSGMGLVVLSGAAAVLFFGSSQPLPDFPEYPPMLVHGLGAFALIALLATHIGAAFYHQLLRHDHLLARMGIGPAKTGWE